MSYHRSMLPLGALGYPMPEMASYGLTDSDAILPTKALCGSAKVVQSALKDQGFYNGQIDGILGAGSVSAIKAFSLAKGIGNKSWPDPVFCGKLKEQQNLLLNSEYEKRNPVVEPPPDGGVVSVTPGSGSPSSSLPGSIGPAAPASEDNTMLYAGAAAFVVIGLVGLYLAMR